MSEQRCELRCGLPVLNQSFGGICRLHLQLISRLLSLLFRSLVGYGSASPTGGVEMVLPRFWYINLPHTFRALRAVRCELYLFSECSAICITFT
jgi:hypothetical protein